MFFETGLMDVRNKMKNVYAYNHINLFCFIIYMSGTIFIVKEKTEKYKEQVFQTEHGQSNEITTEETIVLLNCDNEIGVSFTFIPMMI